MSKGKAKRVLIGCEYSATVRKAFAAAGCDAWSCDLLPSDEPGQHIQGDVLDHLDEGWDIGIFHPPCTYLCNSGVRWLALNPDRWQAMVEAARFFNDLLDAPIGKVGVENPIMHRHARRLVRRDYTQIVQPWQFGDGECKATCLWLRGLPPLRHTHVDAPLYGSAAVAARGQAVHRAPPGPDRWKIRSKTFEGIARAMAEQWGAQ